jgi:hypothetical protein
VDKWTEDIEAYNPLPSAGELLVFMERWRRELELLLKRY